MNIFVCIKQVPDTESKIKLNAENNGIDEAGVKWIMNPYDEYAVEEALKLKASIAGSTVKVLSLGPKKRIVDSIRTALAMGADEGIAIDAPGDMDAFSTAKALSEAIKQEGDSVQIFTGKLSIDANNSSVSQMLAEFLGFPHATVVSKYERSDTTTTVEREIEGGTKEVIQLTGVNVVAANKGLNTPRYASLPGIMKAKKKPMKDLELSSLNISDQDRKFKFSAYKLPAEKAPVKMLEGEAAQQAAELAKLLREDAKVI